MKKIMKIGYEEMPLKMNLGKSACWFWHVLVFAYSTQSAYFKNFIFQ